PPWSTPFPYTTLFRSEALVRCSGVPISVDTSKAEVAEACLDAGAEIVNDVTALSGDPRMAEVVRSRCAGAILMHMQGTPATMQLDRKSTRLNSSHVSI